MVNQRANKVKFIDKGLGMAKAAVWIRVSTSHQDTANQLPAIEQFCQHRGYEIVRTFVVSDSAWQGGKPGGDYRAALKEAMAAAHRGEFGVVVCWALDRLTREGAEGLLRLLREFDERGCTVMSVQEDWLSGSPTIRDVMVAFAGWTARQESDRRSERIKAGLEKRKAAGHTLGRPAGAKDRRKRSSRGYVEEQARRKAGAA